MRLNRRQLRRLIESTIYEQALDKGMSKGEKEDAKQAKDAKDQKLAKAILGVTLMYLHDSGDQSTASIANVFKTIFRVNWLFKISYKC